MRFFVLLTAVTILASLNPSFAATSPVDVKLIFSDEKPQAVSDKQSSVTTSSSNNKNDVFGHYGPPSDGCEGDEIPVQIQGVPGMICTPGCSAFKPCPSDVPDGVTAQPVCALKDQEGHEYCILLCNPDEQNLSLRAGYGSGECGDATCQPIQGRGICTYQ